jgi:hypothetical protein
MVTVATWFARVARKARPEDRVQFRLVLELRLQVDEALVPREVVDFQRGADVAQGVGLERAHQHQRAVLRIEDA